MFFFFKQKTAYEMRISDWSSDVCSSDLVVAQVVEARVLAEELELDRPGRAVSLLADDDLGQPLVLRVFLVVVLVAVDEDDHVRILLDGAGFAQVRHYRTLVGAGFQRAVEIGRASCRERVCQYV